MGENHFRFSKHFRKSENHLKAEVKRNKHLKEFGKGKKSNLRRVWVFDLAQFELTFYRKFTRKLFIIKFLILNWVPVLRDGVVVEWQSIMH